MNSKFKCQYCDRLYCDCQIDKQSSEYIENYISIHWSSCHIDAFKTVICHSQWKSLHVVCMDYVYIHKQFCCNGVLLSFKLFSFLFILSDCKRFTNPAINPYFLTFWHLINSFGDFVINCTFILIIIHYTNQVFHWSIRPLPTQQVLTCPGWISMQVEWNRGRFGIRARGLTHLQTLLTAKFFHRI